MFLYLALTGGTVQLPDAVAVRDSQINGDVEFLDDGGSVVARFRRVDLLLYSMKDVRGMRPMTSDERNSNCVPA